MKLPVYLDNNSTTPLDPRVLATMHTMLAEHFGNPASATHSYGWYAQEVVQIAREEVAAAIGATADEIIFTSGATEANNLALKGIAFKERSRVKSSKLQLITVATEHHSVLDTALSLKRSEVDVQVLPVDREGRVDIEHFTGALRAETFLVSMMLANNEIGTIHDITTLAAIATSRGVIFHCDATQAIGKIPVDVRALGVDLLSLSAHKFYGPKGVGVLFRRRRMPELVLEPLLHGASQEQGVRAGTLNVPGIVGLGKAAKFAVAELDSCRQYLDMLTTRMYLALRERLGGVKLNGPEVNRLPGNLHLSFEGVDTFALVGEISAKLAVSVAAACTTVDGKPSHVLEAISVGGREVRTGIRFGIGRFTTEKEIEFAIETVCSSVQKLRH